MDFTPGEILISGLSVFLIGEGRGGGIISWGLIHTGCWCANSNANPLMLLACSVDTPIHINRFHLLRFASRVLCGLGLKRKAVSLFEGCTYLRGPALGRCTSGCRSPQSPRRRLYRRCSSSGTGTAVTSRRTSPSDPPHPHPRQTCQPRSHSSAIKQEHWTCSAEFLLGMSASMSSCLFI